MQKLVRWIDRSFEQVSGLPSRAAVLECIDGVAR